MLSILLSYLFQVSSRLTLITASSSFTIDDVSDDERTDFGLYNFFYVFAPFFIHWVLLYIIYLLPPFFDSSTRQSFKGCSYADQIMHILSNTFIALPLTNKADQEEPTKDDLEVSLENEKEESKGREVSVLLVLTGLELALQLGIGYYLKFWNFNNSFCCGVDDWGTWLFPMLCWAIGCAFLLAFYKIFHTWSSFRSLSKTLRNFDFKEHCCNCIHCKQPSEWYSSASPLSRSNTKSLLSRSFCKNQPRKQEKRRRKIQHYTDYVDSSQNGHQISRSQHQRDTSYSSTSFSHVRMMMSCGGEDTQQHMGQFLQDGEKACFMSHFFKK